MGQAPISQSRHCLRSIKVAALLNQDPGSYSQDRMTYDLRRLRLHGLIERQPHSNRCRVTQGGIRIILFFTLAETRIFSIALAIEHPLESRQAPSVLVQANQADDRLIQVTKLAA